LSAPAQSKKGAPTGFPEEHIPPRENRLHGGEAGHWGGKEHAERPAATAARRRTTGVVPNSRKGGKRGSRGTKGR